MKGVPNRKKLADYRSDPNYQQFQQLIEELPPHMRGRHAVLDENGKVIPADLMEWAIWFERSGQRLIEYTEIQSHTVSTVFTGLDMNLNPFSNHQLWFETMVFGPPREEELMGRKIRLRPSLWSLRTATKEEALGAHEKGRRWLVDYLTTR
jgi:hypothetical protein